MGGSGFVRHWQQLGSVEQGIMMRGTGLWECPHAGPSCAHRLFLHCWHPRTVSFQPRTVNFRPRTPCPPRFLRIPTVSTHLPPRRAQLCHLDRRDAESPHIDLLVITALLDDLGCHPVRRADECVELGHRVGKLRGDAKVSELHQPVLGQQDVAALDVAVHLQTCKCGCAGVWGRRVGELRGNVEVKERHEPKSLVSKMLPHFMSQCTCIAGWAHALPCSAAPGGVYVHCWWVGGCEVCQHDAATLIAPVLSGSHVGGRVRSCALIQ
eukprot:366442-Chlamydomonas_euryale.AAC.4